ncbi:vegetative incompatibility protein HET-E-1 [Diplogelasinospora grovesii]|uniref:Vegetative incompatibility protein HET-E-1 n=1 Tax=Diplogelasinospora grovesii TaxID=303347 RepID=A0AAN6N9I0_9PEZI|nr:vegetative incompatibility protein HET-E-1 [Diplogelasinospora grovesii]
MFRRFRRGAADQSDEPAVPAHVRSTSEPLDIAYRPAPSAINRQNSIVGWTAVDRQNSIAASTVIGTPEPSVPRASTTFSSLNPSRNTQGLSLIQSAQESVADIIFVHGLGGTSWNTWCWEHDPDFFWPAWLQDEEGLSNLRIFTYGYNANIRGPDTPLSILDFAESLLVGMRGYGYDGSEAERPLGSRPIIFLAHSMGGLVVKKAYTIGKIDDRYSQIIALVRGIIFFSTPHRGSSLAETLNRVLSVMVGLSKKVYVSELESNSTSIRDINRYFLPLCGPLQLVSLYETLSTRVSPGVKKMVVGEDTGVLNYEKEIRFPMNADHHTVCKYQSREDENYRNVVSFLRQITRNIHVEASSHSPSIHRLEASKTLEQILGIQEDPVEDLDKHRSQALTGSCEWLRSRESFIQWLSASDDQSRLLCLSGLPGTGKSTLAAMTIDHLQKSFLDQSCQYHFFMESQPTKKSIAYCLRSIAFQLASTHRQFAERLIQLDQDMGDALASQKAQTIWSKVFEGILFRMEFERQLHWVIDAVDEAETPPVLLRLLSQMQPLACIKVMLLSRPTKDIASIPTALNAVVRHDSISVADTIDDIRAYVHCVVREALPVEESLQGAVTEQVISKAEGSFLWTHLALDTLRDNWHTHGDIESAMSTIPKGMASLYHSMVLAIESQDPKPKEMARRILTWAACGFRPLKVAELQVALQPEFKGFANLRNTIIQICGNFVRLDNDTVSLIHSTARQFLITPYRGEPELIPFNAGHESLAIACLRYLSDDRWRSILFKVEESNLAAQNDRLAPIFEDYSFLKYAVNNWAYHVRHSPPDSSILLQHLKLFFGKQHVLTWIQAAALSRNLPNLPQTARFIKLFLKTRRTKKKDPYLRSLTSPEEDSFQDGFQDGEVTFLQRWSVDLIRLLGKFGMNLAQSPSAIYKHVPPFCPHNSIISETYARQGRSLVQVSGIPSKGWDDNLARLSVGQDETASKVRCAGTYVLALVSTSGTIVVWSAETCEELRRLEHEEYVVLMEVNEAGSMVVSSGRFTLRVWDIATGRQLHCIDKDPRARPMYVSFGKLDTELVVAYDDCAVVWYDLTSSTESRRVLVYIAEDRHRGCPRLFTLSPDLTRVAIAYRGRPVFVWDLLGPSNQQPRRFICAADETRWNISAADAFNAPEVVAWHPDGDSIYILYQDTTIVHWHLIEDEQIEHPKTEAREMVISIDGSFLLTSTNSGSFSVWALPRFNLIYRLQSEEFVRDLTFSPDAQRIYDVRGSICSVWEPDALVRPDDLEEHPDGLSSIFDGSLMSEAISEPVSEPVFSQDGNRSLITALVCANDDHFFCCGRDDGTVTIHEMATGKKVKKVMSHDTTAEIIALDWSPSRKYLVSADDMGEIVCKRLRQKDGGTNGWAVYPVFETCTEETVTQFLFSLDESLLLIGTASEDQIWNLKTKSMLCKRQKTMATRSGKWMNHPFDPEHLVYVVDLDQMCVYKWADFEGEELIQKLAVVEEAPGNQAEASRISLAGKTMAASEEIIQSLSLINGNQFLIIETLPDEGYSRHTKLSIVRLTDSRGTYLQTDHDETHQMQLLRRRLSEIESSCGIQRFLGCYWNRIAFIDQQNWLCTCDVGWEMDVDVGKTVQRSYFLPRDWLNSLETVQLVTLSKQGLLMVPRNGEVAIVRYTKNLNRGDTMER